jgi:hypothetical protein
MPLFFELSQALSPPLCLLQSQFSLEGGFSSFSLEGEAARSGDGRGGGCEGKAPLVLSGDIALLPVPLS